MSDDICLLIAVLYGSELMWCALKIKGNLVPGDPMDHRELIHSMLPMHVRDCGPIVEIEELFEVTVVK